MNKLQKFFKDNSSTMLTIVGSAGVVTSVILGIKATPKALELINKAQNDKGKELTKTEIVKVAWKPYIPTFISSFATISCILGANYLNKRTQASLISAYAFLNNTYQEYRNKVSELYGDEADQRVCAEIAKSKIDKDIKLNSDKHLFFDYESMRYFESTFNDVIKAENFLNEQLAAAGYVTINDFYRELDLELLDYGDNIGWEDHGDYHELKFEHQRTELDDGLECWIITVNIPPSY